MPGGRPKGSTSALAARASRRNLAGAQNGLGSPGPTNGDGELGSVASRREAARLAREEAQAVREQAKARKELGDLCVRSEAIAELARITQIVRAEIDRASAYLDPGLSPDARSACESALTTVARKIRNVIADKVTV